MANGRRPGSASVGSPAERIAESLAGLCQEVMRETRIAIQRQGLTMPQYLTLLVLFRMGPTPTTFWARKLGFPPSTISEMVEVLVRGGYATRAHDTLDRRRVFVSLTAKGRQVASQMKKRVRLSIQERCRVFSPKEAKSLAGMLAKISPDRKGKGGPPC